MRTSSEKDMARPVVNHEGMAGEYQPVLKRGRQQDGSVLEQNIADGKRVGEFIESTLGPHGMDKLYLDEDDEFDRYFEVTNDGAYLLKRVPFATPAAKLIAKSAAAQEESVGDGTTTTAIYASGILRVVEPLIEKDVHPTTIIRGVNEAVEITSESLHDISMRVSPDDRDRLVNVARTALSGRVAGQFNDELSGWIVDAALSVGQHTDGTFHVDADLVQTETIRAGTLEDTEIVRGMVLKKSFAGWYEPGKIQSPVIALVTQAFARQRAIEERIGRDDAQSGHEVSYRSGDPETICSLPDVEVDIVAERIEPLVEANVDVVFVEDRVEDELLPYFEQAEIAVVRNTRADRLEKLAKATGATINTHLDEFTREDTGTAESLEYCTINGQDVLFLRNCEHRDAVSVFVRGSTWMSGWELERNITNAVRAVGAALEHERVVPGGGAAEIVMANNLRNAAPGQGGREALVLEATANAVEDIPKCLARNAGMDAMDTLLALRNAHAKGCTTTGILGAKRTTGDVTEAGILEATEIKQRAFTTAASIVTTILRVDDVIMGIDAEGKYKHK